MRFEIGAAAPAHPKEGDLTQDEIIDWIEKGVFNGMTVSAMLRADDRFPDRSVWYLWRTGPRAKEIDNRIARAREEGFDEWADECFRIAYDAFRDITMVPDKHGKMWPKVDGENIQRSRLKIDTILKLLSFLDPVKYGNRIDLTTMGKEISADVNVTVLATRMQSILAKAAERKLEAPTIEGELS